jgi:hypothetical protein
MFSVNVGVLRHTASSLLLPGTSGYSDPAYQLQSELLTATNLVSQEVFKNEQFVLIC